MGGVLLKGTVETVVEKVAQVLEIGFTKKNLMDIGYREALVGKPFSEILLKLKQVYQLAQSIEELTNIWTESYLQVMVLNKELLQFIQQLKQQNYQVALISNLNTLHQQINEERGKIFELFDPCVLSCEKDVAAAKPAKDIFEYALNQLPNGVKASECIFIDDREKNLLPAKELGFTTIHYTSNAQLIKELGVLGVSI